MLNNYSKISILVEYAKCWIFPDPITYVYTCIYTTSDLPILPWMWEVVQPDFWQHPVMAGRMLKKKCAHKIYRCKPIGIIGKKPTELSNVKNTRYTFYNWRLPIFQDIIILGSKFMEKWNKGSDYRCTNKPML